MTGIEVTEADREKAAELAHALSEVLDDASGLYPAGVELIAQALAQVQAPFLTLADEAERKGRESSFRDFAGNPWPAHIYPHDIRRAAGRPA